MKRFFVTMVMFVASLPVCASPKKQSAEFLRSPFDITAKKLSPNFIGHSEMAVYNGLSRKAIAKGKFETTKQYEARQLLEYRSPLYGNVRIDSPLAFVQKAGWCDYDADSKKFSAHFVFSGDKNDILSAVNISLRDPVTSYVAHNGFGAPVTVYRTTGTDYGTVITNPQEFWFADTGVSEKCRVSFETKITPGTAMKLERNIRALMVCYATYPYRVQNINSSSPEYNSPFETYIPENFVAIRLKSIWFYDIASGHILAKMGPKKK